MHRTLTERLADKCELVCGFWTRRHRLAMEYLLIAVAITSIGACIGLVSKIGDMCLEVQLLEAKLAQSRETIAQLSIMLYKDEIEFLNLPQSRPENGNGAIHRQSEN